MMAYQRDYVLCVLHDGSPVREIHGKVSIPFHSEYKVRLKNKNNSLRTKARVWIDGRKVSNLGDFILHPGETLDLERFLDCDMESGNRFKFVPLSDSRVNDPTDSENGIIKVEFYREQSLVINWGTPIYVDPPLKPTYTDPWYPIPDDTVTGGGPTWVGGNTQTITSRCSYKSAGPTHDCCFVSHSVAPEPVGATVEGSVSNQKFVEGQEFLTEASPTVLTLRLSNTKTRVKPQTHPSPGHRQRYCPSCGKRRQRRTDKFCSRCGSRY